MLQGEGGKLIPISGWWIFDKFLHMTEAEIRFFRGAELLKETVSPFHREVAKKSRIYFLQIRPKEGKDEAASEPIHTGATKKKRISRQK